MRAGRSLIKEDVITHQNTLVLRFIMLAAILVFHAGQYFHFSFPDCGHLCVAIFFFMSGYGLELSRSNKDHYMRDFMQKRVLGLMIQYWLILMVIALVVLLMQFDIDLLYSNISNAFLRNPWWYITEIVVFYVIYYLSTMIGSKVLRYLWVMLADSIMMLMMTDYFGMDVYLKSGMCFIFGMLWYEYRFKVQSAIRKWYPLILILAIAFMVPALRSQNDLVDMLLCGVTGISMTVVFVCMCSLDARRAFFIQNKCPGDINDKIYHITGALFQDLLYVILTIIYCHESLCSLPSRSSPANPFCRSASYSTIAAEFPRFRERIFSIIGIRMQFS